ncbi:Ntr2p NDAI_0B05050 [Naumovozyma dairenensis CBS 421]|uniref:Uncharacterized protein n=1 Tax=Naumovozyma dairenensis (strain ATCC 10597 / BCRC 20456 / CBS 421 / NBRC 0211 / NRRL Y-12639) TaxID=1071378 RepID=G0W6X7_NAUDC|nr:hypothetical protein NDAI_0B05050 [Naumovozyma dairenensis CBS 421]CCD23538.1 hypothetical protein NDAI_0B05050 [Naumovozyma dairenensis CBS 421]
MQKRNKIKLHFSNGDDVNDNSENTDLLPKFGASKVKPSFLEHDDEDDDDDEGDYEDKLSPIIFKKNKNKISFNDQSSSSEPVVRTQYSGIFNQRKRIPENNGERKVEQDIRILNLEDMSDEEEEVELSDDEDDNNPDILNKSRIEEIKKQREKNRRMYGSFNSNGKLKEKEYVKLLDKDDKLELMDMIKKNGGVQKRNEKDMLDDGFAMHEFEDEQLGLTEKELQLQKDKKRENIRRALGTESGSDSNGENWETNIVSKVVGGDILKDTYAMQLPILLRDNEFEEDSLSSELFKTKLETKKVRLQLTGMKKEKESLDNKRDILLSKLNDLVTGLE